VRAFGGSFYSELRERSSCALCLEEVDPNNAQIPVMTQHLSQKLKKIIGTRRKSEHFHFLL
jgi:hypothetical protein